MQLYNKFVQFCVSLGMDEKLTRLLLGLIIGGVVILVGTFLGPLGILIVIVAIIGAIYYFLKHL